jgi:two-component sensor histidine kinase
MQRARIPLAWASIWIVCVSFGLALALLYARLPADGSTGDLSSFTPEGFAVKWLLEERDGGLQPGDVILSVEGNTLDHWLSPSTGSGKPDTNKPLSYRIVRDGEPMELQITLSPVSVISVVLRWIPQLLVAVFLLFIGAIVFVKRPRERPAQLLMTFCVLLALQYWGDAYNMQYAALIWRRFFWVQLFTEHIIYSFGISTITYFALSFPLLSPILRRSPRLVPMGLYCLPVLAVVVAMATAPNWASALAAGYRVSWFAAIALASVAIGAGVYSALKASEPIARAQVRWIIWCACVEIVVAIPFYVIPLLLSREPIIPHPVLMMTIAIIPTTLGISILRYRLFDINVIINRTLVYGTLTGLLIGGYFALVRLFTELLQLLMADRDNSLAVLVSTVTMAIAFAPLRKWLQNIIDRVFYKSKVNYKRLLNEMGDRLTASTVLEDISHLLTSELPRRLQISGANLAILDRSRQAYFPADNPGQAFLPEAGQIASELREQKYVLRLQAPPGVTEATTSFLRANSIELCIPLVVGEQAVGFYVLGGKLSGNAYSVDEIELLRLLGKQAGVAVENSRLFRAESEQREFAQALVEASEALGSTLNIDELLDRIMVQVDRVIPGDAISIITVENETATVVRGRTDANQEGLSPPIPATRSVFDDPVLMELSVTSSPVFVENLTPDHLALSPGRQRFHELVAAPITIEGAFSGALLVYSSKHGCLSHDTARNLSAITNHAATAISNARLWSRSQEEIVKRMKSEERIRASLEEKNVLLQEIHHRVKNNLQVISSLLSLQTNQTGNEEVAEILRDSQVRIKSIALVHESLYRSENFAQIESGDYIRRLADQIFGSFGDGARGVSMRYSIEDIGIGIIQAVPCGLILNELITNSLKHAFPGDTTGEIFVELSQSADSKMLLVVGDNGVGMPPSPEYRRTDSLGLQIVETLVRQLDGTAEVDTSDGVVFSISFPGNDQ